MVSSSPSESIYTTPSPFSRGAGVGEALTVAKGIATIGAKGAGEGAAWLVIGVEGAEEPEPVAAS